MQYRNQRCDGRKLACDLSKRLIRCRLENAVRDGGIAAERKDFLTSRTLTIPMKCMPSNPENPQLESPYKQTWPELFYAGFLHVIRPVITLAWLKLVSEEFCQCSTLKTSLSITEGAAAKETRGALAALSG